MEGHQHGVTLEPGIELAGIRLLHEFAWCSHDNQVFQSAVEYGWAWDRQLTETVNVRGRKGATFLKCKDQTLVVLRRMFHCQWLLHISGLTVRGQFGAQNFIISIPHLSVRLRGVHLTRYTPEDGNLDYGAFERSVTDMFLLETIPDDIGRWLELIGQGVRHDGGYLLRYYIGLMEPRQQLHALLTSRRIIFRLKRADPALYRQLKTWFPRYYNWQLSRRVNDLLRATQRYVNPWTGKAAVHNRRIKGVLKLVRDCWEHPIVDVDEAEFIIVVQDDFPKLFRDVHEALSQAGLLGQLRLETTMS